MIGEVLLCIVPRIRLLVVLVVVFRFPNDIVLRAHVDIRHWVLWVHQFQALDAFQFSDVFHVSLSVSFAGLDILWK